MHTVGVLYEERLRHIPSFTDNGVKYTLTVDDAVPPWTRKDIWASRHPITNEVLPTYLEVTASEGPNWEILLFDPIHVFFFHHLSGGTLFFPKMVENHNAAGSVKENARWKTNGARLNTERGKHYTSFNASDWDVMEPRPFYDRQILVPRGAEDILEASYGRDWRRMEQRVAWESQRPKSAPLSIGDVPPKDVCPSPSALPSPSADPDDPVAMWGYCERPNCRFDRGCLLLHRNRTDHSVRCCSDELMAQLVDVHSILQAIDPEHFIIHGTLLGAVRDADVIPWEADVDIAVQHLVYNKWKIWKSAFESRGYIVFKQGILRICKRAAKQVHAAMRMPMCKFICMTGCQAGQRD